MLYNFTQSNCAQKGANIKICVCMRFCVVCLCRMCLHVGAVFVRVCVMCVYKWVGAYVFGLIMFDLFII